MQHRRAATLIELIVVVAIIAAIASLALLGVQFAREAARCVCEQLTTNWSSPAELQCYP